MLIASCIVYIQTIMILTTLLIIFKDIEFFFAVLTHGITLSLDACIRGGCMLMLVCEIDNGSRCSQKLSFDEITRFLRRVTH